MAQLGRQISHLLKCLKAFFQAQKSHVVLNTVSQHSFGTGLFLSGVLDVSIWDLWALCVTLSSQFVCLYSHCAFADASLMLPSETGSCSHAAIAMQAIPALQSRRLFWPYGYRGLIFFKAERSRKMYNKIFLWPIIVGLVFCLPQIVLEIQQHKMP